VSDRSLCLAGSMLRRYPVHSASACVRRAVFAFYECAVRISSIWGGFCSPAQGWPLVCSRRGVRGSPRFALRGSAFRAPRYWACRWAGLLAAAAFRSGFIFSGFLGPPSSQCANVAPRLSASLCVLRVPSGPEMFGAVPLVGSPFCRMSGWPFVPGSARISSVPWVSSALPGAGWWSLGACVMPACPGRLGFSPFGALAPTFGFPAARFFDSPVRYLPHRSWCCFEVPRSAWRLPWFNCPGGSVRGHKLPSAFSGFGLCRPSVGSSLSPFFRLGFSVGPVSRALVPWVLVWLVDRGPASGLAVHPAGFSGRGSLPPGAPMCRRSGDFRFPPRRFLLLAGLACTSIGGARGGCPLFFVSFFRFSFILGVRWRWGVLLGLLVCACFPLPVRYGIVGLPPSWPVRVVCEWSCGRTCFTPGPGPLVLFRVAPVSFSALAGVSAGGCFWAVVPSCVVAGPQFVVFARSACVPIAGWAFLGGDFSVRGRP